MFGKAFKATFGVGCALVVGLIALALISGAMIDGSRQIRNVLASVSPAIVANAAAPTPQRTWVSVKEWTGDGKRDTEKFTVGDEWRIDWDFQSNQTGAMFISLYDDTAHIVDIPVSTQKDGANTSFRHKAGTYYLSINSANGTWKVGVQDMR